MDINEKILIGKLKTFYEPIWRKMSEKEKIDTIKYMCNYYKKVYNINGKIKLLFENLNDNTIGKRIAYEKKDKTHYVVFNKTYLLIGISKFNNSTNINGGIGVYLSGIKTLEAIIHELYHCKQVELINSRNKIEQEKSIYEKLNSSIFTLNNTQYSAYIRITKEKNSEILYHAQPIERKTFERTYLEINNIKEKLIKNNIENIFINDIDIFINNSKFDMYIDKYKILFDDSNFEEFNKCLKKYVLKENNIYINSRFEEIFLLNALESAKFINDQQNLYNTMIRIIKEKTDDYSKNDI